MTYWILSANPKTFNHAKAFNDFGFIDWEKKRNYCIGDIVYIYGSAPYSKVVYKTRVIEIRNNAETNYYWCENHHSAKSTSEYVRLKLLKTNREELATLDDLKLHGMSYAPQGPCRLKQTIVSYLEECFGGNRNAEEKTY